jgi:gliding motility-associated-like protein
LGNFISNTMSPNRNIILLYALFIVCLCTITNLCNAQLTIPEKIFTICKGDVATVHVTVDGPLPVFVVLYHVQSTVKYTYTSETSNSFDINLMSAGTYNITKYGTGNDTVDVESEAIIISFYPPVSVALVGDGTFCTTYNIDSVSIAFTGTPPYTLEYINNGVLDTLTTDSASIILNGYEERTIETIRVSDAYCHLDTSAQLVHKLASVPTPEITGENMICEGGLAKYSANFPSYNYSWLIPDEAVFIDPSNKNSKEITLKWNAPGNHLISMQILNDEGNCASEWVNFNVNVIKNPIAKINIDTTVCFDLIDNLTVNIPVSDEERIYWPHQDLTSSSTSFSQGGNYTYQILNEYECSDTGFVAIADSCTPSLFVPEAFSPNGDQINDVLELFGLHYNLEFSIYSESGQVIFTMRQEDEFWDGTNDGKDLPNGTYYWYAKYTDRAGKEITATGTVNIIR